MQDFPLALSYASFHYRCHPDIIGFSNKELYENKLQTQTNIIQLKNKFKDNELGIFWHDVKGSIPYSASSAYNLHEVDHIIELLDKWRSNLEPQRISIGIVTPFRKQVEKIRDRIESKRTVWGEEYISLIKVGTAHRFQRNECDLVIFSPVVANGLKSHLVNWVANTDELLNVAVTRARGALHIVGDMESCQAAGQFLEALVLYTKSKNDLKLQHSYESPAEEIIGTILSSLNLNFFSQVEKGPYRLDFVITTHFGSYLCERYF